MTGQPDDPPSFSDLQSPFTKAIATRYYDGPLEGFLAHRDWSQACVFRLLDWDRETDLRVFEIARVEDLEFEDAVGLLFRDRRPTWPLWVLPSSVRDRGEQLIDQCFERARAVATVTTGDLLGNIAEWDAANDAPQSSTLLALTRKKDAG
jgi:hypothetical protein